MPGKNFPLAALFVCRKIEYMRRTRLHFVAFLAAFLPVLLSCVSSATTCFEMPALKPLHLICGVVVVSSGDRIHDAKVTVLKAGKEIAAQETRDDGKFSFGHLKAGNYEIRVQLAGLGVASTKVILIHPESETKQEIAVNRSLSGVCSSFSLVNTKEFESELKPIDAE